MQYSKKKKIPVVPGKINIFINKSIEFIDYFHFGEITRRTKYFNDESGGSEINVRIEIVSPSHFFPKKNDGLINFSKYYKMGGGQIYYFRKLSFLKLGLSLRKVGEKSFCFSVTPDYLHFIKLKVENLYPLGVHLSDLLMSEIIKGGDLVLYGGAFLNTQSHEASLILAPSGTGKTCLLLKLIEDKVFKLLSEEVSYLDLSGREPSFICVPNTVLNIGKNSERMNFLGLFSLMKRKSILEVFGSEIFSQKGTAKRIYLLENSESDSIEREPINEENFRKVMAIQRLPFSCYWNPLLRAYSYYGHLDLDDIYKKEGSLLRNFFSKVELFIVRASSYKKFPQLIGTIEKSDLPPCG